ncbi:MAG: DUF554 domain-containing protein [Lachnospiraceae bacterium]|jgi:uncharacterized membrane protein YqgA involved in biofilm formation|nr:DUF554 domain-containing protein [Lachnospiraceae bacterium]
MPIGILVNACAIFVGGLVGMKLGPRFSENFKINLNTTFGACAMAMGISSIVLMKNLPAVILAVIAGTILGLVIHLGDRISDGAMLMEKGIARLTRNSGENHAKDYQSVLITCIVLFCASGSGIYGSLVSGMTGDHSILLAKTVLDLPTAMIFSCTLGITTAFIAVPQCVVFLSLFGLAGLIIPFCSEAMIADFKACGGILLLATGFRMIKVKEFPVAEMIPAMVLVMPISYLWTAYIVPLLG